jgi:hypothetical protein
MRRPMAANASPEVMSVTGTPDYGGTVSVTGTPE